MRRPNRRQAAAAAALGLTGLSAFAATRFSSSPGPSARASTSVRAAAHPDDFIPSADTPRIDGRLTLIWFSEPL